MDRSGKTRLNDKIFDFVFRHFRFCFSTFFQLPLSFMIRRTIPLSLWITQLCTLFWTTLILFLKSSLLFRSITLFKVITRHLHLMHLNAGTNTQLNSHDKFKQGISTWTKTLTSKSLSILEYIYYLIIYPSSSSINYTRMLTNYTKNMSTTKPCVYFLV